MTEASPATEPKVETPAAAVAAVVETPKDAKTETAVPSAADDKGAKKPPSLLDAVRSAVKAEKPAEASPAPKTESETDPKPKAEGEKPEGEGEGDETPQEFHKHPAWQRQRAKIAERDDKIKAMEPKVQAFDRMADMMKKGGLTTQEVDAGFNIMTLMRNDPAKAYESLKPYMAALEQVLGVTLPADLQERVAKGFITKDDAAREAKTRGEAAVASQKATKTEAARKAEAETNLGNQMAHAVTGWENQWKGSDPDYARKQPRVEAEIRALMAQHGRPDSVDGVLKLVKQARQNIEDWMKANLPVKSTVSKPPESGSSVKVADAPAKTLREVVARAAKAA